MLINSEEATYQSGPHDTTLPIRLAWAEAALAEIRMSN
jgi:hypothetical protein